VAAVLAIVVPLLLGDPTLYLLSYCGIMAIACIGMVLLIGRAGQLFLAQPVLMGLGAYTTIALVDKAHAPFVVGLLGAIAVTAVLGAFVGILGVRLGGIELAIASIGVLLIGQYVFGQTDTVTGGSSGTASDVTLSFGPLTFESMGSLSNAQSMVWIVWLFVFAVAALALLLLRRSPGRTWIAIRENSRAVESIGIDVRGQTITAVALSASFAGVSGALLAGVRDYLSIDDFGFNTLVLMLAIVVLGGAESVVGAMVGAVVVPGIQYWVSENGDTSALSWLLKSSSGSGGILTVGSFNTLVFGVLIAGVLLVEPSGLVGYLTRLARRIRATRSPRAESAASSSKGTV
jgi:branched-chain amino acid transport system permease protein